MKVAAESCLRETNLVLSERRELKPLTYPVHCTKRFFTPVSVRIASRTPRRIARPRNKFRLQMHRQRREQTHDVPETLLLERFRHAHHGSHRVRRGVIAWVS